MLLCCRQPTSSALPKEKQTVSAISSTVQVWQTFPSPPTLHPHKRDDVSRTKRRTPTLFGAGALSPHPLTHGRTPANPVTAREAVTRFTVGGVDYTLQQSLLRLPSPARNAAALAVVGAFLLLTPRWVKALLAALVFLVLPLGSKLSPRIADRVSALVIPTAMRQVCASLVMGADLTQHARGLLLGCRRCLAHWRATASPCV